MDSIFYISWVSIETTMCPHMFHEAEKERLVGEERRRMQPIKEILDRTSVRPGDLVADLGCGNGYLSVPMAQSGANVIAVDRQREMLQDLVKRGKGMDSIMPVQANLPQVPIRSDAVDHIFLVNIFHELKDKDGLIRECSRILRPGGVLTLVEFQKRPTSFGPPMEERIDERDIPDMFVGFTEDDRVSLPEYYQFELRKA
ncbi:MAG: hypothetical protein A4E32_01990 [Methanomassiliicoccales archaeon PtaU1.Bin124]|nr:MAG: hypothetical protein A4E32_01990 [Methanomassiliicoccales archaeon PtaU1.Bin124]